MKFYVTLSLALLLSTSVFAQTATRDLANLYPGYHPTVLSSYAQVDGLFEAMPNGFRDDGFLTKASQCFHRAEIWSYNFDRNYHVQSMKVFLFFTHQFKTDFAAQSGHAYDWWFHVAPYVLVKDPSKNKVEERVMDPMFADGPMGMHDWTQLFVTTGQRCAEFVSFSAFRREVEVGDDAIFGREHCYIVRVPANDFDPIDVEARTSGKKTSYAWDASQIDIALQLAPLKRKKREYRALLGF